MALRCPSAFSNRLARASEKYLLFEMLAVESKWYVVQYGNNLYSMYGGRLGSHLSISDVFEAVPSRVSAKRVVCAVFGVRPFSLPHALRRLLVAGVTVRGFRVPCSTIVPPQRVQSLEAYDALGDRGLTEAGLSLEGLPMAHCR